MRAWVLHLPDAALRPGIAGWLLAVLCLVMSGAALGKAPAPLVRATVAASQPVLVGQQIPIDVTVLVPNFFVGAPPFPALQIPGAIVTMPDERGLNSIEVIDGVTYAGISKAYLFIAQQAGDFVLPPVGISVSYAGDDGKPRQTTVTLPPTRIVTRGAGAAGQGSAGASLPVARITITQRFDRPLDDPQAPVRAGDAVVRTLETFAEGTQAMMIPPPRAEAPRGVRVFAADPVLRDGDRDPAGRAAGHRIDRFTYVFEDTGTYTLPAVTIAWFDAAANRAAGSVAPAVKVAVRHAAKSGALAPAGLFTVAAGDFGWRVGIWLAAVALGGAVAWRLRGPCRRLALALRARVTAWQGAEGRVGAGLFRAVLAACRANDARQADSALRAWAQRCAGCGASAWAAATGDAGLRDAMEALQRCLYAPAGDEAAWRGDALHDALVRQQRARRRAARAASGKPYRLGPLND